MPLSFIKFHDILFKNYDFRALDVNKTSILASNSLFYILKASFMIMHFSDQRMIKRQSLGNIKQVKSSLSTYNPLFSFASCCALFDLRQCKHSADPVLRLLLSHCSKKKHVQISVGSIYSVHAQTSQSTTLSDVKCCNLSLCIFVYQ